MRGGWIDSNGRYLYSAFRFKADPRGDASTGLRVVLSRTGTAPAPQAASAPTPNAGSPSGPTPPPAIAPFDTAAAKAHQEAWAKYLGQPVETTNSVGMKLVVIPPGEFLMGKQQVPVTLTKPFRLGAHEVTGGQWNAVMGTKQAWPNGENCPAHGIDWNRAVEFCQKLTEQERAAGRLLADQEYRLPTEAEWEFACRAGTATPGFVEDEALGDYAWYSKNAQEAGEDYPHEVGLKKPNPWGLHDIYGNVFEWCLDGASVTLPGGIDPRVPSSGKDRVQKGGSFRSAPKFNTSWHRAAMAVESAFGKPGFRVALALVSH
jgi:formylglycine-generating enzyme required for sulfatase activity